MSFDPFNQSFTLYTADGIPINITVPMVDEYAQYAIRISINYGAQLGASLVLFLILLLLTRPEKRTSSVFILNAAALLLNAGRLLCQSVFFTTPFAHFYPYFAGDFSRVPTSAYAESILGVVLATLLLTCVETSLVLQTQVVCATVRRRYRHLLLAVSVAVALTPVGFRFGFMIENCKAIVDASTAHHVQWLESTTNIVTTVSICFFCSVFIGKLGVAIRMRKSLGVREFGPMKAIFVMGCQTLVIPALFSILQYFVGVPELASNVLTLVTLSLPLSSIWAGVALDYHRSSTDSNSSRRNLWNLLSISPNATASRSHAAQSKQDISLSSSFTASTAATAASKQNTTCYAGQYEDFPSGRAGEEPVGYGISVARDISVEESYRGGRAGAAGV
ncbi:alpha-factor pheromone receptor STE2 [Aspergillus candidus]|uniref:Mating-type alpha-pheromone receptor PreB n=1 Tax=Aspergillus candidus TaxID=41067 RepID=A0A2I2F2E2_ASPCN|nr:mating-type alpha-pheromone receptor PreB [Aspergillus candidus]PLB34787.1 mating-type alpha-pheromone receptor PreB [Aspergillus candidus]